MFKDKVKKARKEMGLTQAQFGKLLGVSRQTICDVERGNNKGGNLKIVSKLCEVTGKPVSFYLEDSDTNDSSLNIGVFDALEDIITDIATSNFSDNEGNITRESLRKDLNEMIRLTIKKIKEEQLKK